MTAAAFGFAHLERVTVWNEIGQKLVQRGATLLKHVGRQFHDKNRARIPKHQGCATKNVTLQPVDIELDQLHLAVGAFAQDAVEAPPPARAPFAPRGRYLACSPAFTAKGQLE